MICQIIYFNIAHFCGKFNKLKGKNTVRKYLKEVQLPQLNSIPLKAHWVLFLKFFQFLDFFFIMDCRELE